MFSTRLLLIVTSLFALPLLSIAEDRPSKTANSDVTDTAVGEATSAATREQQELLERAADLRHQQDTTETLLRKQERYLDALEQELEELNRSADDDSAS